MNHIATGRAFSIGGELHPPYHGSQQQRWRWRWSRWRWLRGQFPVRQGAGTETSVPQNWSSMAAVLWNFSWIDASLLRLFASEAFHRWKGDVRGHPRGPHHMVPRPEGGRATLWCGRLGALLCLCFGLCLRVRKNRRFGFSFVQFREYFLYNISDIKKLQKTGTGTVASC
jgi:hypothetical protein